MYLLNATGVQSMTDAVCCVSSQCRRHFSAVACEGGIYAVGGWYLDSLVSPDSNTALYTAVERYDPWGDSWRYASSV